MNKSLVLTVEEKASIINRDEKTYGSFAEIGAGQEVARWFFRVGLSSNTIAKTMSAYDMTFSDTIYGREKSGRYVCESRLIKMLDHEYRLIEERLGEKRGHNTQFFAFANTVAAKSYSVDQGHGWIGVRFQKAFLEKPCEIVLHINLLDPRNILQQEAIGLLSVNLIFGALYLSNDMEKLLKSLVDNIKQDRLEIDMIRCSGPAFSTWDNRLINFHLVRFGLGPSALFGPDQQVHQPSEVLYGKNILIQKGKQHTQTDLLESALPSFMADHHLKDQTSVMHFVDMSLDEILESDCLDLKHLLSHIDHLNHLGYYVLVSNEITIAELSQRLKQQNIRSCGFVLDRDDLQKIFQKPDQYSHFKGGVMEAMGRLFSQNTYIYVPSFQQDQDIDGHSLNIEKSYLNLYNYLFKENKIKQTALGFSS